MLESERLLQESEDRLRLAIEAVDAGTFDYYPLTGILRCSDRCREFFGLPTDAEADYETYVQAIHPADRGRVEELIARALQPESDGRFDTEYRAIGIKDGKERWIAAKGLVVFDLTEWRRASLAPSRVSQQATSSIEAREAGGGADKQAKDCFSAISQCARH
jgi:PAS domain S-box-containing protein